MSKEDLANPILQEELLLAINSGAYEKVVDEVACIVQNGESPSFLSVVRSDLLLGFAHTWQTNKIVDNPGLPAATYKASLFNSSLAKASEGDPSAILVLPKLATSVGQLAIAMELVLANKEGVQEQQADRQYLQYLGTFDPQHIGHRIAIQSALKTTGAQSSALVHVMGQHPLKPSFSASYKTRYLNSEERIYTSPLLDNTRVTQVDMPGGVGLANCGLAQMRLLASVSGDKDMRWLIGSDKFMLDVAKIRHGESTTKAVERFTEPHLHSYVVHRQSDGLTALENDVDYIVDRFGASVTLVREASYDCAPASSTQIKSLRGAGMNTEADHMEFYELLP